MKVYIVVKSAIYRHETFGVYTSEPLARVAAERMLQLEPDDHHSAEVLEVELDQDAITRDVRHYHDSPWMEKIVGVCQRIDVKDGFGTVTTKIAWEK